MLPDKRLSAPPIMLCGAVNIHRCHLPLLFLEGACTGTGPGHRRIIRLPGCLHIQRALSTYLGGFFFAHGHFTGGGRSQSGASGDDCKAREFSEILLRPTTLMESFSEKRGPSLSEVKDSPQPTSQKWAHWTRHVWANACSILILSSVFSRKGACGEKLPLPPIVA